MNSWEPTLQTNQRIPYRPDWFEVFLPVSSIPLSFLLILIFPIFLLAMESLFAPVVEFVQSLLMPVNAGMAYASLPLLLIIKILIFSVFTFTGITLLLLKINCLYHEVWSYYFQQPHAKHVPYHPDQQESMVGLFNWTLFRWFKILGPPLGWTTLTVLVGTLGMLFFNSFTDFGFFTFQLQVTLGFFVMGVLAMFTGISYFKAVWAAFQTILGDVAAITEPEKPAQVVYDRVRKLAFSSPWIIILYPLYFLFYVALISEIALLITFYDIQDILSFRPEILNIFGLELATFVVFLILGAMKFMTYHNALGRYYDRNP